MPLVLLAALAVLIVTISAAAVAAILSRWTVDETSSARGVELAAGDYGTRSRLSAKQRRLAGIAGRYQPPPAGTRSVGMDAAREVRQAILSTRSG